MQSLFTKKWSPFYIYSWGDESVSRHNYVMAVNQYLCTEIVSILLAKIVFKTFLQGVDTRRSCRIFTFQTILSKIKPTKVIQTYKIHPIIDHLNKSSQENYSNDPKQSTDERMTKFKGPPSMRQYLKMKPIKWGFKWWFEVRAQIIFCMNLIYI